ncbi:cilia- and flagella-associated protein HOATZ-like [Girardinichthys multiradiatus]|uniref:cilia- and flagella-associated protein HOATZ-like n=1 Tax=Girardinichthys multiradiatus TaxID=208333 RepID=UPI001FABE86C|nr:cilia- and flagella-associated protein HOATZ-like [Girardinichthys multiradiatus]XP_047215659.1 cilia- and flagella-associated protein HOATZ-like [Girardinichthys multiradiatus]
MAHQSEQEGQFDELFTVFHGSSPEDVSHARQLWSSLSLLPPLESRLVSAETCQRLPVFRPQRRVSSDVPNPRPVFADRQREEERRRYEVMADQRKEIRALLGRQRQLRIQKELLSATVKPERRFGRNKLEPPEDPDTELEKELVKQLQ